MFPLTLSVCLSVLSTVVASILSDYDVTYGCNILYGNVFETFNAIRSITECTRLCGSYDKCLFLKYDTINKVCQLNSERYKTLSTSCPVVFKYGMRTNSSCCKLIGDGCTQSSECYVTNSRCVSSACQCDWGYSYHYADESCRAKIKADDNMFEADDVMAVKGLIPNSQFDTDNSSFLLHLIIGQ